jgi:hypothetical protein
MQVRIFRQRVSQVHESEIEINDWLQETKGQVEVEFVPAASTTIIGCRTSIF